MQKAKINNRNRWGSHLTKENNNDFERQKKIESLGYEFLRFTESDIVKELEAIIRSIEFAIYTIEENQKVKP